MFIQCSDCDYKYLVNSADLKPQGRMVECANCNHRWYQEPINEEELLSSSVPKSSRDETKSDEQNIKNNIHESVYAEVKNLPSTVVNENKVSLINTFLVDGINFFQYFLLVFFSSTVIILLFLDSQSVFIINSLFK